MQFKPNRQRELIVAETFYHENKALYRETIWKVNESSLVKQSNIICF